MKFSDYCVSVRFGMQLIVPASLPFSFTSAEVFSQQQLRPGATLHRPLAFLSEKTATAHLGSAQQIAQHSSLVVESCVGNWFGSPIA